MKLLKNTSKVTRLNSGQVCIDIWDSVKQTIAVKPLF